MKRIDLDSEGLLPCSICGKHLPLDEFSHLRNRPYGVRRQCRSCVKEINKKHPYRYATKQSRRQAARRYREEHPDRAKVAQLFWAAKRRGSIIPKPCDVCGSSNTHGHHDNYDNPYSVRWLCPKHHAEVREELCGHRRHRCCAAIARAYREGKGKTEESRIL
jgi:hypothetical protein